MKASVRRIVDALVITGLVALAGCGTSHAYHATPVAVVPASSEEQEALRGAICREWRNWSTIHTDGVEEEEKTFRVYMTFRPDGTGDQGIGKKRVPFTYKVDGRNILTSDPSYPALRIDRADQEELRLFWYHLSVTLVFKPESAFPPSRR